MKKTTVLLGIIVMTVACTAQQKSELSSVDILPGAYQTDEYLKYFSPLPHYYRVGIFANHTSTINNVHLVDTLKKLQVNITKIFGPEHGFRGNADAGEKVDSYIDKATGIPVVSLYGKKRKPSAEDLKDVDILLFDIQDVGVRFYTYISSLQEFIETAIEYNKPLIILDRPNPNGFYIDGPVLDTAFKSFVGMQPVPVVYGMTIGEYAKMILAEKWLHKKAVDKLQKPNNEPDGSQALSFRLTVIPCKNYTHKRKYILPIKPSPNLPDMGSVYWYPSTCFFEGTVMSEGRGTEKPFQIFGHPSLPKNLFAFTPISKEGAKQPKLQNQVCYGWDMSGTNEEIVKQIDGKLQLRYLLKAYELFPKKDSFFLRINKTNLQPTDYFFNKLAGNAILMQQIRNSNSETEIRKSWEAGLDRFKKIRKKYLLYSDFE